MAVNVTLLPGVMKRKGWPKGAALMERWFVQRGADKGAGSLAPPEIALITIDWVLTFPRAKSVYDEIFSKRIWADAKVVVEIRKSLAKAGALTTTVYAFPQVQVPLVDPQLTPTDLDKYYVTYKAFTQFPLTAPFDDLTAALANFTFRIVPRGIVRPKGKTAAEGYLFGIDSIGVFVMDSYDFVGDQSLGHWDTSEDTVGLTGLSGEEVTNADFRTWRSASGKGGDFLIYSPVKWVPIKAETIDLK